MRSRVKFLGSLAVAGLVASAAFSVPAEAGGDYAAPASSGRTIWEGFHVGLHAGGQDSDYDIGQTAPVSPLVSTSDSDDGFVGGFVYGSSWQFGNMVVGTDSAYNFGDNKTGPSVAASGAAATAEVEWSSESRLRAGVLVNPSLLIYGTAGIAFASVDVSGSLIAGGSDDDNVFGFTYGAGAEVTMGNRWFARIEYIRSDFDEEKFRDTGGGTFDVDLDSHTVRGAVGYRFDWSPFDLLK